MPKVGNYRANSVIYFQGDLSEKVFVLQKGKVSLNYADIESNKDIHEIIQTGEFFGVKSALGKYPREENALVMADAQVLVFTVPEFEVFAQANPRIIVKMLKVFSNQLRRVHKQVDNLLQKTEAQSPEAGLFRAGEYYLRNRQYSQSKYVFSRYLDASETGSVKYGDGKGPAPIMMDTSRQAMGRESPGGGGGSAAGDRPAATGPQKDPGSDLSDAAKGYYDAVSLFSSEKYKEALTGFKRIVEANEDAEYVAKSLFDMGRCLLMLQQYDLTVKHFTSLIQTYPKHPDLVDALYYLGQAWEKKGETERAKGFYKKILSMEADEDASTRIRAKKALRLLEEGAHG